MKNPFLAGILSSFVPGLGQIYVGRHERGAAIPIAVVVASCQFKEDLEVCQN